MFNFLLSFPSLFVFFFWWILRQWWFWWASLFYFFMFFWFWFFWMFFWLRVFSFFFYVFFWLFFCSWLLVLGFYFVIFNAWFKVRILFRYEEWIVIKLGINFGLCIRLFTFEILSKSYFLFKKAFTIVINLQFQGVLRFRFGSWYYLMMLFPRLRLVRIRLKRLIHVRKLVLGIHLWILWSEIGSRPRLEWCMCDLIGLKP